MSLGTIALTILLAIIIDELIQWSSRLAVAIINWNTRNLSISIRERYREEWLADLDTYPGRMSKLFFALDTGRAAFLIDHYHRLGKISPWTPIFIRMFDFWLALLVILIVFPVLFAVYVLIRLETRGSGFEGIEAVGRDGKVFKYLLFRTRRRANTYSNRQGIREQTALGKLLVKANLNVLPLLINIVRGDMSFVGPRPERPNVFQKTTLSAVYKQRFRVRPGITGLAQINSLRRQISSAEAIKFDLVFLQHYGLPQHLKVLCETFSFNIMEPFQKIWKRYL
ncbi:sugar transferase [Nitrosospira lacus]|uniref:Bacterial sugar transferase domain-containing protein n=1 Tax=Nitrosospira lacus TaxID=1288494 RepID=A0A1W6SR17_9PROT|nr:sugar transferase [Nitrosospira lacus]ARO88215.1 sugar transferase [Nitrosospira lacus]